MDAPLLYTLRQCGARCTWALGPGACTPHTPRPAPPVPQPAHRQINFALSAASCQLPSPPCSVLAVVLHIGTLQYTGCSVFKSFSLSAKPHVIRTIARNHWRKAYVQSLPNDSINSKGMRSRGPAGMPPGCCCCCCYAYGWPAACAVRRICCAAEVPPTCPPLRPLPVPPPPGAAAACRRASSAAASSLGSCASSS